MKSVKELTGVRTAAGQYAFEVEVTGNFRGLTDSHVSTLGASKWRLERDGSIGEGFEFVFKGPCNIDEAKSRINTLWPILRANKIDFNNQDRAGVHLHLNVQDWNVNQLFTFICLYYIFEDVLVEWCGDMRTGNHFCLRVKDAEYLLHTIITCLERRDLRVLNTALIRYSALNLTSLFKYGSLEFRSMRTPEDEEDAINWMLLINKIVEFSNRYESPLALVNNYTDIGGMVFIKEVFGDLFTLLRGINDLEYKVRDGVWIAQDIANATYWSTETEVTTINPFAEVFNKDKSSSEGSRF